MKDTDKTREQLLEELAELRHQLSESVPDTGDGRGAAAALWESARTARALIDAQHESAFLIDTDGTIVTLNETAARRLGGSPEELVGRDVAEFFPPDINERRRALGREVVHTGKPVRSMDQRDGVWFDYTIYPVFGDRGEVVRWAVFARDITQQVESEKALKRKDEILGAVTLAAQCFTRPELWEDDIQQLLRQMGEAVEVSRVYIFKNHTSAQGRLLCSQRFEWTAAGYEAQIDNPELQDFDYAESGFDRWVRTLSAGETIYGLVSDMPAAEREVLAAQSILSITVVPIFVGSEWWGFIGFDDCRSDRAWSAAELGALSTASGILGAAIQRRRMERLLRLQRDVALTLASAGSVGAALGQVLDTLSALQWVDIVGLYLADEETGALALNIHHGLSREFAHMVSEAHPGTPEYDLLVSTRSRCMTIADLDPSPQVKDLQEIGLRAVVCLPVWSEGTLAAVMALGSRHYDTVPSATMDALEIVCAQVGDHVIRMRAEEAVRQSEEEFRALAEQSSLGVGILQDSRFVFANEAFARIFGDQPDRLLAMTTEDIRARVHPDDRELVFGRLVARQAGEDVIQQYEFRIIRRDGSERFLALAANRVFHGGRPAVQAVIADITERKKAEEALQQSEEKYRHLIENSIQGLLVIQDQSIVLANEAFARMIGYTVDDLLHLSPAGVAETIHPEDRKELMARLRNRQEGKEEPRHYKARALHKDGRAVWVDVVSDIIDYGGRPATQVLTVDITEQKKLEDRILQAHKMEAVGRLAGGVAHDFNNLLTAISGFGKSLARKLGEENPLREEVDEICFAADRAASLTRQLLAFSRKQVIRPELIQLNQVVLDMEGLLRRLLGRRIEVVTRLGKGLGLVRADRSQVEQILMNLVINARDAMSRGGWLEIETEPVDLDRHMVNQAPGTAAGAFVRLSVTDSGVGLKENDLPHLFEPFFSTKGPGRGTGLGLSVVYGIVQQHKGLVEVSSTVGQGSRFDVYLPVAVLEADAGDADAEAAPVGRHEDRGKSLLLVEDEEGVRKLVETVLREANYRVVSAASAEEALAIYERRKEPFDLLLSDVILPGLSGVQLVEELRDRGSDIQVALISGFILEGEHQGYIDQHRINLLPKPFSDEALLAFLWNELKGNRS